MTLLSCQNLVVTLDNRCEAQAYVRLYPSRGTKYLIPISGLPEAKVVSCKSYLAALEARM